MRLSHILQKSHETDRISCKMEPLSYVNGQRSILHSATAFFQRAFHQNSNCCATLNLLPAFHLVTYCQHNLYETRKIEEMSKQAIPATTGTLEKDKSS